MGKKDELRSDFIAQLPETQRNAFKKAYAKNRPAAIRAKCLDCCCGVRDEVTNCQIFLCPLFELRPYQNKKVVEEVVTK